MTNEQRAEAYLMLLNGATYEETAQKMGVSKQRLHQLMPNVRASGRQSKTWIYPNIKQWMRHNRITICHLSELLGCHKATLGRYLSGKAQPDKTIIDKILEVTGMNYEEAFKTGKADNQ